jgi:hypothetical protein
MVTILFIYSENCEHCQKALTTIESAIIKCKEIPCKIIKLLYHTKEAISVAINNDIDDLPGFVIGKAKFVKDNYTEEKVINAIKEADINDGKNNQRNKRS